MSISPEVARAELARRADAREELRLRESARSDLLSFAQYTHPRWQTGEHHKKMCEALDRFERGECRRLIISTPPRHTKSELASVRLPAYYMGRNPANQVFCASYGDDLALGFGSEVLNLVRSPRYKNLFPKVRLRADSKSKSEWKTDSGGVYHAAGIGGAATGKGAHRFIIDDPIKTREEADSPTHREKVWRWFWSAVRTRLMPGGCIMLMMTRWHEDDLAGRLVKSTSEPWEVLELKAITNEDGEEKALWPEWYPLDELQCLRKQLCEAGRTREWHALYQQEPKAEEGSYFMRHWFSERWEYGDSIAEASA